MRKNKALISIVIILGLIIILGLGALIFGLYEKANDPSFSFFKHMYEHVFPTCPKFISKESGRLN